MTNSSKTCPVCKGNGRWVWDRAKPCGDCNGTGTQPNSENIKVNKDGTVSPIDPKKPSHVIVSSPKERLSE